MSGSRTFAADKWPRDFAEMRVSLRPENCVAHPSTANGSRQNPGRTVIGLSG